MNAIQRQIQPLNPQIGFNVNSIQTHSTIKPTNSIHFEFHSNTDSTIKPTNWIQCQFHSNTDPTNKPSNRIQCEFYSKTDTTVKPSNGIQRQRHIQPLNTQIRFNVNSIKDRLNH